jgi:hypothetical protein
MAEHYSVAWMDRWLKQPGEPGYADADARLLADADWCDRYSFYFRAARRFPDRAGALHATEDVRADCVAGVVDPPAPCADGPRPAASCSGSTSPGASQLAIRNGSPDAQDALKWKWAKGGATALADFGDPVNGSTGYTVCLWDRDAGTPALVESLVVPPGGTCAGKPCWRGDAKGFRFTDRTRATGVKQLKLRAGAAGKAHVELQAKGQRIAAVGAALPFAQSPAVTVELRNDLGECWRSDFSAPARGNTSARFDDRGD